MDIKPLLLVPPQQENDKARTMVAPGSMGRYTPTTPTKGEFMAIVGVLLIYSVVGGLMAGTQPSGAGWRLFSWHPFLMMVGMIGCLGSAAVIKKLGGYTNTKIHGILSWVGIMCSMGGLYAIYKNKENRGAQHWQTNHAMAGLACILSCVGLGLVGGVVLHPDFGIDKGNKTIRLVHKFSARVVLLFSWFTAFMGLYTLTQDTIPLLVFSVPLVLVSCVTLM